MCDELRCNNCNAPKEIKESAGCNCGWVSVKERLPAESSECIYALRACGSWIYGVVHYSAKHKLFNVRDIVPFEEAKLNAIEATHWMPLPEPPKMKGGE